MPDSAAQLPTPLPRPHRLLGLAALLIAFLALALFSYRLSEHYGIAEMREAASHQLDILGAAIDSEVTRHASIPSAVELNAEIVALLRGPSEGQDILQAEANSFLQKLNDHLGGPAIFVLDTSGTVVASSDWIFSDNLLGSDLSYMPFFRDAVRGTPARHYAVDHIRHEPGYYFALPIRDETQEWKVIGVAVVKSGIREVERRWLAQEAPALIVDRNDVVLLASPPEWRYATLRPQSRDVLDRLGRQQFAGQPLGEVSLDIDLAGADEGRIVRLPKHLRDDVAPAQGARPYLAMSRHLSGTAWRIVVFSDLRPVGVQAATHAKKN